LYSINNILIEPVICSPIVTISHFITFTTSITDSRVLDVQHLLRAKLIEVFLLVLESREAAERKSYI
jgi:hypothetical protein